MHTTQHGERVTQAALSARSAAQSTVVASWRRSMIALDLDPAKKHRNDRLTEQELHHRRQHSGEMMDAATPLLDYLVSLVGQSGCGVFLSDQDGVVLEHRLRDGDMSAFQGWNLWAGAHWGEAHEGTNGIGTCIAEGRRVIIHRDEHFAARNTAMSCIDAPIFGVEGQIVGALDVSSARSDQSAGQNRLISDAVAQAAKQIETHMFRAAFPGQRIMIGDAAGQALLAIDADDVLRGANRAARRLFGLHQTGPLPGRPASDVLGHQGPRGFDRGEAAAIKRALLRNSGNASAAARDLGIGRATLYRKMHKLGLTEVS